MKIASIESFRLYPKAIKEAWTDEYLWPSRQPTFLVKVTAEDGTYGVCESVAQDWYYAETGSQVAECVRLYDQALRGTDPENFGLCHLCLLNI